MQDEEPTQLDEQRIHERRELDAPVVVRLENGSFQGKTDNVSLAGIMLFVEEPLRVTVEIQGQQGVERRTGKLVRLQRLNDESTGLAIEFDA